MTRQADLKPDSVGQRGNIGNMWSIPAVTQFRPITVQRILRTHGLKINSLTTRPDKAILVDTCLLMSRDKGHTLIQVVCNVLFRQFDSSHQLFLLTYRLRWNTLRTLVSPLLVSLKLLASVATFNDALTKIPKSTYRAQRDGWSYVRRSRPVRCRRLVDGLCILGNDGHSFRQVRYQREVRRNLAK